MERLKTEYREKYAARTAKEPAPENAIAQLTDAKPADFLRSLLDSGPARPSVNDNRPQSFVERAAAEEKSATRDVGA